jgi:hypothetical protein
MVAMCGRFPTGGWDVKGLGPGLVGCRKGLDFCGDLGDAQGEEGAGRGHATSPAAVFGTREP